VINPSEEEFAVMKANMDARRSAAKAKTKGLKREVEVSEKNSEKGKKLKTGQNSLSGIAQKLIKLEDPDMAKTKASYSVSKDPHASEVYKSLFTTHDKAVNQTKGHTILFTINFCIAHVIFNALSFQNKFCRLLTIYFTFTIQMCSSNLA
jgi:hypothetical protein